MRPLYPPLSGGSGKENSGREKPGWITYLILRAVPPLALSSFCGLVEALIYLCQTKISDIDIQGS